MRKESYNRLLAERDALRAELAEARRTWPRCRCGGELFAACNEDGVAIVCPDCGLSTIEFYPETDAAFAAFRAAEQEQSKDA